MEYDGIEIENAKERDMLIMSNLSDVQEMLQFKQYKEANDRLNAIKIMLIKTREMITPKGLKEECLKNAFEEGMIHGTDPDDKRETPAAFKEWLQKSPYGMQ